MENIFIERRIRISTIINCLVRTFEKIFENVTCNATNYFLYSCDEFFLYSGVIGMAMIFDVTQQEIIARRQLYSPLNKLTLKYF